VTRDEHFAHARELITALGGLRRAMAFTVPQPTLVGGVQWHRAEALRCLTAALAALRFEFSAAFPGEPNPYEVQS
jgi:hypothetical protein